MDKFWVLVADKAKARLFELCGDSPDLIELEGWTNPDGRAKGIDLQSDRPTRTFDRFGPGRHAAGSQVSPKEKSAERFAHDLGDTLERGRVEHRFDKLVLIAPPAFLGTLNGTLGKQLRDCVALSLDKDLTVLPPDEIRGHLPRRMTH